LILLVIEGAASQLAAAAFAETSDWFNCACEGFAWTERPERRPGTLLVFYCHAQRTLVIQIRMFYQTVVCCKYYVMQI